MGALGEGRNKTQHIRRRFPRADFLDNGRADDTAIGHGCNRLRRLGRVDAKAYDHRQIGRPLDPRDLGSDIDFGAAGGFL